MKFFFLLLFPVIANAQTIYQVDKYGNIRHDKERYIIRENKIYTVDKYNNIRNDKPTQQIVPSKSSGKK